MLLDLVSLCGDLQDTMAGVTVISWSWTQASRALSLGDAELYSHEALPVKALWVVNLWKDQSSPSAPPWPSWGSSLAFALANQGRLPPAELRPLGWQVWKKVGLLRVTKVALADHRSNGIKKDPTKTMRATHLPFMGLGDSE